MHAFLIDPAARNVEAIDIADGLQDIKKMIGFETVDFDEIDDNGDRLYFDENCFIRTESGAARFKVDNLAPVAGRGVVIGANASSQTPADAVVTLEQLIRRVTFS